MKLLTFIFCALLVSCGIDEPITPNTPDFVTYERTGDQVSIHINSTEPVTTLRQYLPNRVSTLQIVSHYYDCINLEQVGDIEISNATGYFLIPK